MEEDLRILLEDYIDLTEYIIDQTKGQIRSEIIVLLNKIIKEIEKELKGL